MAGRFCPRHKRLAKLRTPACSCPVAGRPPKHKPWPVSSCTTEPKWGYFVLHRNCANSNLIGLKCGWQNDAAHEHEDLDEHYGIFASKVDCVCLDGCRRICEWEGMEAPFPLICQSADALQSLSMPNNLRRTIRGHIKFTTDADKELTTSIAFGECRCWPISSTFEDDGDYYIQKTFSKYSIGNIIKHNQPSISKIIHKRNFWFLYAIFQSTQSN